jgi:arogenate dehydrogenase (NADP+)
MNIGIIGLGLIGGSLGLDLRSLGHRVLGVSRQPQTCEIAIARGAVDHAEPDFQLLAAADVIFLCTPIGVLKPTVEKLIPHLQPHVILTDVGSVKQTVVQALAPLWVNFVGGHPMAGTAETGIEAAVSDLFVSRPYVITPTVDTPLAAIAVVDDLARSLGSKIYQCTPAAHDQAVAWISHLPVVVSASLIAACQSEPDAEILNLAQQLASSGFRDTSRVGGGNPELGRMMAEYNQAQLLRSLKQYQHILGQLISDVENQNWSELEQHLHQTQQARPLFVDPQ